MPMILNEEQNMLKDTAKAFCGTNAPISQLRKLRDEDSADGFDRDTWAKMVELGWSGINTNMISSKRRQVPKR